jgi:hypothetical protein
MAPFRQVEGNLAGPQALGILVPPGRRTVVILRPRALDWDLLPVQADGNGGPGFAFWQGVPEKGGILARELFSALQEWTQGGLGRVEPVPAAGGTGYQVHAGVGRFVLITCARIPGAPYQPVVFPKVNEALSAAERITAVLCPTPDRNQEVYFNTANFAR